MLFSYSIHEPLQQVTGSFTDYKSTFLCSPVSVSPEVVFAQLGRVESLLNWDWLTLWHCEETVYRVGDKEPGTVCLLVSKVVISGMQSCKGALLWSPVCVCVCVCVCYQCYNHTHSGLSDWVSCLHSVSEAEANCLHDCCAKQCALWWKKRASVTLYSSLRISTVCPSLSEWFILLWHTAIFSNCIFSCFLLSFLSLTPKYWHAQIHGVVFLVTLCDSWFPVYKHILTHQNMSNTWGLLSEG